MRKLLVFALVLGLAVSFATDALSGDKPRIGVLRFTNNTSAGWWSGTAGRELQDMLISELVSMKTFQVLERKELDAVLKEQDLGASGRISESTRAQIGKIKGARYLIAATVSSYERNTSGGSGGFSFKGISLGGKRDRAYIAVDLKVIDTTTGEVVDARTVEATSKSGGLRIGFSRGGFSGTLGKQKKSPVGKAIRACIMEIAEYLECSLAKQGEGGCLEAYNVKEQKRRKKTKSSIDLE